MSYLGAHRYGLTKVSPTDSEQAGGWRQVWEHPAGLRAARNPATGYWQVIDGQEIRGGGFSSSLSAVAAKIDRLVRDGA